MAPGLRNGVRDLGWAVGFSLLYAAIVVARRHGDWTTGLVPFESSSVFYNAPVVAPFFLFVQERFRRRTRLGGVRLALDVGVLALAASRIAIPVPYVSGHALFLTYGLCSTRSLLARASLAVVLLGTAIVKVFLWHDPSLVGGAALGIGAALAWARSAPPRAAR